MAKFWWAGANKDREIHWINWKDLGRAKKEASWAWASLLEVRDLILKGARWQILEGQKFIDLVLRVWNIDLLSHFVPEAERVTISHIQVGSLLRPDKLVWHFKRNGSYSVKSVYKWCHNQLPTVNHDRPPSSHSIDSRPPSSTFFVVGVPRPPFAPFVLKVKRPWSIYSFFTYGPPGCGLGGCNKDLDRTMSHVVFSCWFIWRARCDAIFNEVYPSHFRTLRAIVTALNSFNMASTPLRLSASDRISYSIDMHCSPLWSPPPVNWIKVNVDACWKGDSLCGHIGVVAKDSLSSCKAVKSVRVFAYSDAMAGSSCSRRMFTGEKLKFTGGANMATDFVVRNMSPEMCGLDWVVIPPSSLVGVLNNDSLPCPLV
ncbi:hypothetical protein COP1_003106 [Malus domestica]